ncbi:acyltransferase family protein [Burkholderia lata]|uniref:acyltransferase family protein n=1 Tax=Burkholderia lata (strain ATCC 17760 / DSM 23089 / LMG 22485 / NCIMB 9086 / R18194 / 383) TaxID=482957 RepID=UPI0020C60434|nr:acyltransferase [Burkholderia lata]
MRVPVDAGRNAMRRRMTRGNRTRSPGRRSPACGTWTPSTEHCMQTLPLRSGIFRNLQCARAFAALAVVGYHMGVLPFGQAGVDVFFVISGFIMSVVAPREGRTFLRKRLIRIVPLYWLTTLGVFAIAVVKPQWLNSTTAGVDYLVKSLLFVPYVKENGHWGPLNLNGWTLEYEMLFYLVIAGLMLFVRARHVTTLAALALALFCAYVAAGGPASAVVAHLGQPFVLEFGLGVLACRLLETGIAERLSRFAWLASTAAALVAIPLAAALSGTPAGFERVFWWGMPACMLIVALVALDLRGWSIGNTTLARLGDASYSIYLLHPYVIGAANKIVGVRLDAGTWSGMAAVLATLAAVCACGYACHAWIERPMLAALKHRLSWRHHASAS